MNSIKPLFIIAVFVVVSIFFGSYIRSSVVDFTGGVVNIYRNFTTSVKNLVNEHFRQSQEIRSLREQNKELQKSAVLLSTFANELDQILLDKNSSKYEPDIKLVRTLTYANISDYNKFWVEFPDFNKSKVYGAIFQGKTAGIIVNKDGKPLSILQTDEKCTFSVYVGDDKIPGIANGNSKNVVVKYIPQWLNPKIGDEVYTSGLDGIFFTGIPVGVVKEILNEDLYKSAVIKPYVSPNMPAFLYIVTKER